jgi:hypothetical protein
MYSFIYFVVITMYVSFNMLLEPQSWLQPAFALHLLPFGARLCQDISSWLGISPEKEKL